MVAAVFRNPFMWLFVALEISVMTAIATSHILVNSNWEHQQLSVNQANF
jgi:hypothetical protein